MGVKDNLIDIIEELSELVYVSDVETHDLYYMNRVGRETFKLDLEDMEKNKLKCHKIIHNNDSPCSFCNNHILNYDTYYTWEFENKHIDSYFFLKDKLIDWNGHRSRVEIAFDISRINEQSVRLHEYNDIQTLIIDCVKQLHNDLSVDQQLNNILKMIGEYYHADRSYIFTITNDRLFNLHEWCKENILPAIDMLQDLDISIIDSWLPYFKAREILIIKDIADYQLSEPLLFEFLEKQDIKSLIVFPLYDKSTLIGYIGLDNPPLEKSEFIIPLLTTLSHFVSTALVRKDSDEKLLSLSYNDALTNVKNRNSFKEMIEYLNTTKHSSVGVAYMDMNGLKEINDQYGHSAGDEAIKATVKLIKEVFDKDSIYRVGGDEFVIIADNISEAHFINRIINLKNVFHRHATLKIACGYIWSDDYTDLNQLIKKADELMYKDKENFYRFKKTTRYRYHNDSILKLDNRENLVWAITEGKFDLSFVPLYKIDNTIKAVEVFSKYYDENGVTHHASEYIKLLEMNDTIVLHDLNMLRLVCNFINQNDHNGNTEYLVYISYYSMDYQNFSEEAINIINDYDFDKRRVILKFSQKEEMDQQSNFTIQFKKLSERDFHFYFSDFGLRNTNLFIMTTENVKWIILSYQIADYLEVESFGQLIENIIRVCKGFEFNIVVANIKDEKQIEIIKSLGVEYYQGNVEQSILNSEEFSSRLSQK